MNKPENAAIWSKERFDAELEKGYNDMLKGCVTPLDDVYAKLSEAISEIKNGAKGADAEKFIKGLMNS
ncbi:MAG: hypothetical protein MJY99_10665 [Fibrobacter sp.]|nr:hypothetical protein [Fibrobacter sp.]